MGRAETPGVHLFARLSFLSLFALSTTASAQVPQPYVPLTGATQVTTVGGSSSSLSTSDEGYASIPLGFSFPWYGQQHTSVGVTTNGLVLFGAQANAQCNYSTGNFLCYSGGKIPNTTRTPHAFVAPWWRDLDGKSAGRIRYTRPSPSDLVIEWSNWSYYGSTNPATFSFQVRLNASGLVQVHYGPHSAGTTSSITAGYESADGTQGAPLLPCAATGANCSVANWPADTLFTIGQPQEPDLSVRSVLVTNAASDGATLSLQFGATIHNAGLDPASDFGWAAYLSSDATWDSSDVLIHQVRDLTLAGGSSLQVSEQLEVPVPGAGRWYVLVVADPDAALAEFSEINNVGVAGAPFYTGVELIAAGVSGPATAAAGANVSVQGVFGNAGLQAASAVEVEVKLGAATVHTATVALAPGQQVTQTWTFPLSNRAPAGAQHWSLHLDPRGTHAEFDRGNNVAVSSSATNVQQADLAVDAVALLEPTLRTTTQRLYAGMPALVSARVRNGGTATGGPFSMAVVVSADSSLSLLSDVLVTEIVVPPVPRGTAALREIPFTVPSTDKHGKALPSTVWVFVIADSSGEIPEVNESDNWKSGGVSSLHVPAADLVVSNVLTPHQVSAGESAPVQRTISNRGNAPSPAVRYRWVASANADLTTSDVPLGDGEVVLGAGQSDARHERVRIPEWLPPGTWFIGCIVDPDQLVPELDETNNAAVGTPVEVVSSGLRIATAALPDAVVGTPFSFRLVANAPSDGLRWSHATGTLPPGLRLHPDGRLDGMLTEAGTYVFGVRVENAGGAAFTQLVLRVLSDGSSLIVTTTALPPVVNVPDVAYAARLAAAGGRAPYTWALVSGKLPQGIVLAADGLLSGRVRAGLPLRDEQVTFEVRDSVGARAQLNLRLRHVPAGALVITTFALPSALLGVDYLADLAASDDATLRWRVIVGQLPYGLSLQTIASGRALFAGRPQQAGTFPLTVEVEDGRGRADQVDLLLVVHPARYALRAVELPAALEPGAQVEGRIVAVGAPDGTTLRLWAGALPPGLTLGEDGTLSGQLAPDAEARDWSFTVEARRGGQVVGVGAFGITVLPLEVAAGCVAVPGGWRWPLAAGVVVLLAVRRRRRQPTTD